MKRILIADDDDDIRQLLELMLTTEGYEVTAVTDGAEALRAYGGAMRECRPFSLLVLDCAMPNKTGRDVARSIRELCDCVPIIYLTAHSRSLMTEDIARFAITNIFEKPLDAQKFKTCLAELLAIATATTSGDSSGTDP